MINLKRIGTKVVHPIGVGTWGIGGTLEADYTDDDEQIKAIQYAIEQGQNHIDTAELYGNGHSEELVGKAIQDYDRDRLLIASKVWKDHASRELVPQAVKGMLRRLRIDKLDLLYAHAAWDDVDLDEMILGLNNAVDQELVEMVGVSNFSLEQLQHAQQISKYPISAIQNNYNLLYKQEVTDEMVQYCQEQGIAIVAYRPLGRGLFSGESVYEPVLDMAAKYNKTPAQIALNWLVSQPQTVAIPKSANLDHIEENVAAVDFEMSQNDLDRLSELGDVEQK